MSNPAVIELGNAGSRKGKFKRFTIEDNIGEAIHLHIDNMRIDFTIKDFLEFSSMVKESLDKIDFLCGYKIDSFDQLFLRSCAEFLPNLVDIKIEEVKLSGLRYVKPLKDKYGLSKVLSVQDLPAYKYLKGDKSEFLNQSRYDYFSIGSEDKLLNNLALFKDNKYPVDDKYIVLFDKQNYIRYGQDLAAVLGYLYGLDSKIKVMRFYFKGKKHLLKPFKSNINIFLKRLFRKKRKKL
jgi:hypothetical protein